MIKINKITMDVKQTLTKDGLTSLPVKYHYFDEYGNEIFIQAGEKYIMPDKSIKKFPF